MVTAPIPSNEKERLASLKNLNILDTPPEERFDRITKLATRLFNVPISTISIVDANREWFKSVCGLDQKEGDRAISFCGHAMLANEVFVIPDTKKDERFSDNPMVIGEPYIRFYAGVPLISADGQRIGTFCIKGKEPREINDDEKDILKGLAKWVELELNVHNLSTAIDTIKKSFFEFSTFFESSMDLMCIADYHGHFVRVNSSFKNTLGYEIEELLTTPFINFVHPEDIEATKIEMKNLSKGMKTVNFINRYRKKSGEFVCFQWNATPNKDEIYATARDITLTREKELELEKLNNALIDRELKMVELKKHIEELESKLNIAS